jgi:hypothetical protein
VHVGRVILARVLDHGPAAGALALLWSAPDAVTAALLAALPALGLRSILRAFVDRGPPVAVSLARGLAGGASLLAGAVLAPLAGAMIPASRTVVVAAALSFLLVVASAILPGTRAPALAGLAPLVAVVALTVSVVALLLPSGLLRVEPDQSAVEVVLSGEARRELVRWAPAGQPLREEGLRAHHLRLQRPDGALVGEAWLFGSSAVLEGVAFCSATGRLSLLQLTSLRNDAPLEVEGARLFPHQDVAVEARGPAVVPEWWRPWQQGFLRVLGLARQDVHSAPLPLVDAQGLPLRAAYPLAIREERLVAP